MISKGNCQSTHTSLSKRILHHHLELLQAWLEPHYFKGKGLLWTELLLPSEEEAAKQE